MPIELQHVIEGLHGGARVAVRGIDGVCREKGVWILFGLVLDLESILDGRGRNSDVKQSGLEAFRAASGRERRREPIKEHGLDGGDPWVEEVDHPRRVAGGGTGVAARREQHGVAAREQHRELVEAHAVGVAVGQILGSENFAGPDTLGQVDVPEQLLLEQHVRLCVWAADLHAHLPVGGS